VTFARFQPAVLPVAVCLTLAGCAGNTLAQDLAYEAWDACPRPSTMQLERINTDGTIWYRWQGSPIGVTEWDNCIKKYYADVGAKRRAAGVPPQVAVAPPQQNVGPVVVPILKPGDEWAFRWESPAGNGTYVWSVDRDEVVDGVPYYVIKTGTREMFYRKADRAFSHETVDGKVVVKYTPARLLYSWPLEVGKTWEQSVRRERPVDRQTTERVNTVTVEAEETVTVPAGTFKTFKLVYRNKSTGAIQYEEWYSPETKGPVRLRERLASGVQVRELLTFRLR